jgi:beta-lactam-binding protein with PASTA domain
VGAVRAGRIRPLLLVAALMVVAAALAAFVPAHAHVDLALVTDTAEVEMPDVTGQTRQEAATALKDIGLEPAAYGGTGSPLDRVESQAPTGGLPVLVGSTVKIFLGPPQPESSTPAPETPTPATETPTSPSVSPTRATTGPTTRSAPPSRTPSPMPSGSRGVALPAWLVPALLTVIAVLGGAWLTARGVRARRERRWVAEHVRASASPGQVTETTSDQPGASPTHSIRARPHPAVVDEQVEIDPQDGDP